MQCAEPGLPPVRGQVLRPHPMHGVRHRRRARQHAERMHRAYPCDVGVGAEVGARGSSRRGRATPGRGCAVGDGRRGDGGEHGSLDLRPVEEHLLVGEPLHAATASAEQRIATTIRSVLRRELSSGGRPRRRAKGESAIATTYSIGWRRTTRRSASSTPSDSLPSGSTSHQCTLVASSDDRRARASAGRRSRARRCRTATWMPTSRGTQHPDPCNADTQPSAPPTRTAAAASGASSGSPYQPWWMRWRAPALSSAGMRPRAMPCA